MDGLQGYMEKLSTTTPESGDYTNPEDGLLYCGKCHTPKQFLMREEPLAGKCVPVPCTCKQERLDAEERQRRQWEELERVRRLKANGLQDSALRDWTFANDYGENPLLAKAHAYVDHWEEMKRNNIGLLLWGDVGCGKSFFAGCIANALMERCVPVLMTNFARILNSLTGFDTEKNSYIESFQQYQLLIIDDFGMERGTEYAMEQVYHVIDSRYKSGKPLIVTTNLPLPEIKNCEETPKRRVYDRVLEMCSPIRFSGSSIRREKAQAKLDTARRLLG